MADGKVLRFKLRLSETRTDFFVFAPHCLRGALGDGIKVPVFREFNTETPIGLSVIEADEDGDPIVSVELFDSLVDRCSILKGLKGGDLTVGLGGVVQKSAIAPDSKREEVQEFVPRSVGILPADMNQVPQEIREEE